MTAQRKILLLGARSWIGFRLEEAIRTLDPSAITVGTSSDPSAAGTFLYARSVEDYESILHSVRPDTVVNLLRGEDGRGLAVNSRIATHCAREGLFYIFASSALALDAYTRVELTEDLSPRSKSAYGQFKGACEHALCQIGGEWLVVRFASIHGWSRWKPSRTEAFLSRVAGGETVSVDLGVLQNRLEDRVFAEAVAQAVLDRLTGTIHFGTTDCSDELDFLRRLADAFGQPPQRVVPGGDRAVNLVVQPRRLFDQYPGRFERTEAQTIDGLVSNPQLRRYMASETRAWQ